MEDAIATERERRISLWKEIKEFPDGEVPASFLRERYVYRGESGTYVNREHTSSLTEDETSVAVSIRLTGRRYANELNENGVSYHYPETGRRGLHDQNEIKAAKNAMELGLPIFVILNGEAAGFRKVKLGWVLHFNDEDKVFLVEFAEEKPIFTHTKDTDPFTHRESGKVSTVITKTRPNQHRFRHEVIENYGFKCAVCDMRSKFILDAAHIRGKRDSGSDDWRNGLILCKNHHAAFDNELFGINPETKELEFSSEEVAKEIKVSERELKTKTGKAPHIEALEWRWKKFQQSRGQS